MEKEKSKGSWQHEEITPVLLLAGQKLPPYFDR
jgi:hypothetical protein